MNTSNNTTNNTQALIARDETLASLGEELGQFKAYDSQLPIATIEGTRIVKCLYQVNKQTGKKAGTNSYVRLPTKHLTEQIIADKIASLTPYILSYLQSEEDKIIKNDHKNGAIQIYTDYLSIDKIIAALEVSNESARLTKDKIESWFDNEMADGLMLLVLDKMGLANIGLETLTEEQEAKILNVVNSYKLKFTSLASPRFFLALPEREAMINVITKCNAEVSLLGSRFIAKLEGMKEQDVSLLDL